MMQLSEKAPVDLIELHQRSPLFRDNATSFSQDSLIGKYTLIHSKAGFNYYFRDE